MSLYADGEVMHEALRQRVEAVVDEALTAIRTDRDHQAAIEAAGTLRALLSELESRVAQTRAEIAHEIWTSERLTLAQLATRIGISTGRAGQLVQAGRPPKEDSES